MARSRTPKSEAEKRELTSVWTARIVPLILIAIVGYATYVLVVLLGVDYLLDAASHYPRIDNRPSTGIAIITLYFVFLLPAAITYFRLLESTSRPGLVEKTRQGDYPDMTDKLVTSETSATGPKGQAITRLDKEAIFKGEAPAPPGTEEFYNREFFVCDNNGLPNWCDNCSNWKPDRSHHCSDIGRCVMRLDHFCPWVGGVVSETNQKFFIQFNFYTAFYTLYVLITLAYFVNDRRIQGLGLNAHLVVTLVLACIFFLFTSGMAGEHISLAMHNSTTVENIKTRTTYVAVHLPYPSRFLTPLTQSQVDLQVPPPTCQSPAPSTLDASSTLTPPPPFRGFYASWETIGPASHNPSSASDVSRSVYSPPPAPPSSPAPVRAPSSQLPIIHFPPSRSASPSSTTPLPPTPSVAPSPAPQTAAAPATAPTSPDPAPSIDRTGFTTAECTSLMCNGSAAPASAQTGAAADDIPPWVGTITYPLITRAEAPALERGGAAAAPQPRTFAILRLRAGMNPWDLGKAENWRAVMGERWWDWVLPVRRSPLARHGRGDVLYPTGPEMERLKEEVSIV